MINNFLFSDLKQTRALRHGIFIITIFIYYFLSFISYRSELSANVSQNSYFFLGFIDACKFTLLTTFLTYSIFITIIPRFFKPFAWVLFSIFIFTTCLLGYLIDLTIITPIRIQKGYTYFEIKPLFSFIHSLTKIGFIVLLSVSTKISKIWFKTKISEDKALKEKAETELKLLKSQIHPHFLFNTLNNIYSLTVYNSPKAGEMILKTSDMLGYMLYESNKNTITLEKEIEFIKNYIDLEMLRYEEKIDLAFNIEGEYSNIFIPPMILMPTIENAFKHSAFNATDYTWIRILLTIKSGFVILKVENTIHPNENNNYSIEIKGIGLDGLRKQIYYHYKEKASLITSKHNNIYSSLLKFPYLNV